MITLSLSTATLCFMGSCYPALIGHATPVGQFEVVQRFTRSPGYGGDVLQFAETSTEVFAIHRLWLLSPKQHRPERLRNPDPKQRVITNGCINVDPAVYDRLVSCCSNDTLTIER